MRLSGVYVTLSAQLDEYLGLEGERNKETIDYGKERKGEEERMNSKKGDTERILLDWRIRK